MTKWVEDCKAEYIESLVSGAPGYARSEHLMVRGIRTLFELSKKRGRDEFIPEKEIRDLAGIRSNQTITAGLWNWLTEWGVKARPNFGAGIVERAEGHSRKYRIRKEFYQAVERVLSEHAQQM